MAHRLSKSLLEAQLEALDLCHSLFSQEGELSLTEPSEDFVPALREWIETTEDGSIAGVENDGPTVWENAIDFTLKLTFKRSQDESGTTTSSQPSGAVYPLILSVRLPTVADVRTSDLPPPADYHIAQPQWLNRTSYDSLSSSLPRYHSATFSSNTDYILQIIDYLREEGPKLIPSPENEQPPATTTGRKSRRPPSTAQTSDQSIPIEYRVWLWFPSLSTREKRDDIVQWAPEYELTGFVLAGKPAVMCLEGTDENIQNFMADIKSNSWADIPSFQKKVSERFRTELRSAASMSSNDPTHRIFSTMSEITSLIPQSGQKGNRGNMVEVREFLESKGLGEAFGAVVGGGQF